MLSDGEIQCPIDDDSVSGSAFQCCSADFFAEEPTAHTPTRIQRLRTNPAHINPTDSVPTQTGKWTSGHWAAPANADRCGPQVLRWPSPRHARSCAEHPRLAYHPILGQPRPNVRTAKKLSCIEALATRHADTSSHSQSFSSNAAPSVRTTPRTPRTPRLVEAREPHLSATPRSVSENCNYDNLAACDTQWTAASTADARDGTDSNAADECGKVIPECEVRLVSPRKAVASPRGARTEHGGVHRMRGVVDLMIPLEFPAAPVALFEKRNVAHSPMHANNEEQWHTKDSSPHETRIRATEDTPFGTTATTHTEGEGSVSPGQGAHPDRPEPTRDDKGTPKCLGDRTNTLESRKKRLEELTCGVKHMQTELEHMRNMAFTAATFGEGEPEVAALSTKSRTAQKKRLIPSKRLRHRMASAFTLLEHSKV